MLETKPDTSSIFDKFGTLADRYARAGAVGKNPVGMTFDTLLSPTRAMVDGREIILVGTNNYLGLTFDEKVIAATCEAVKDNGSATTGSRQANGTYSGHKALEDRLKSHFGAASAVIFTTGYQTNLGAISSLAGAGDHLLIDADSHACIYDACRLSLAETIRFRHNDPENLERRLKRLPDTGARLVVVEGLYSMFGDVAPLREFVEVAHAHDAMLFVDEAHSVGCYGSKGRGVAEDQGVLEQIDFLSGTFSKSFSSVGGFCVSRHAELEHIRLDSRAYMFTASSAPANIAAADMALQQMIARPELRETLWARARRLHAGLEGMGFDLCAPVGPIIAVRRPDETSAVREWNQLMAQGIYANLAAPPATPVGTSLLRLSVSAAHSEEEIDAVLTAFETLR